MNESQQTLPRETPQQEELRGGGGGLGEVFFQIVPRCSQSQLEAVSWVSKSQDSRTESFRGDVPLSKGSKAGLRSSHALSCLCHNHPKLCQVCVSNPSHQPPPPQLKAWSQVLETGCTSRACSHRDKNPSLGAGEDWGCGISWLVATED